MLARECSGHQIQSPAEFTEMPARRDERQHAGRGVSGSGTTLTFSLLSAFIFSEYEITAASGQVVDYEVRDTKQHILSKKDDISRGKFSFTSEVFDVYELCFKSTVQQSKSPDWIIGHFLNFRIF